MAFRAAPLFSGRIVSRVAIGRVTQFILRERPNVKHAIVVYLGLPRPTPAHALMRVLHCLCYQGTPLAIRPKIMARCEEAAAALG